MLYTKNIPCAISKIIFFARDIFFSLEKPCKTDVYQVKIILNCPTSHHSALHCNLQQLDPSVTAAAPQEFQTNEQGWTSITLVSLD